MQTACSTGLKGTALATRTNRTGVVAPRLTRGTVVCKAQARPAIFAAAAALPTLLAAQVALAEVDTRLGGEGTSKILGISSIEFVPIIGVLGLVFSLWSAADTDFDSIDRNRGSGDDIGVGL